VVDAARDHVAAAAPVQRPDLAVALVGDPAMELALVQDRRAIDRLVVAIGRPVMDRHVGLGRRGGEGGGGEAGDDAEGQESGARALVHGGFPFRRSDRSRRWSVLRWGHPGVATLNRG